MKRELDFPIVPQPCMYGFFSIAISLFLDYLLCFMGLALANTMQIFLMTKESSIANPFSFSWGPKSHDADNTCHNGYCHWRCLEGKNLCVY